MLCTGSCTGFRVEGCLKCITAGLVLLFPGGGREVCPRCFAQSSAQGWCQECSQAGLDSLLTPPLHVPAQLRLQEN